MEQAFDIPGHQIIKEIGKGGMGVVYLATDTILQRRVAVKVLKYSVLPEDENRHRFRSEAVTLAKLSHPNITMLYNLVQSGGRWCMIMEYVEGETLESLLLRRGALPVKEALDIVIQTLEGLQHAHERGVTHRDLKPANLMISSKGEVKIMDFGIARIAGSSRLTRIGQAVGTPQYMSPEQVKGLEGDYSSDLYSLGIVLYELLTGQMPFSAVSEFEIMQAHAYHKPVKPGALNPAISDVLNQAVLKALAKNPTQRFPDSQTFKQCLIQIAGQYAVAPPFETHPVFTWQSISGMVRRFAFDTRLQHLWQPERHPDGTAANPKRPNGAAASPKRPLLLLWKLPAGVRRFLIAKADRRIATSIGFLIVSVLFALFVVFYNTSVSSERTAPDLIEKKTDISTQWEFPVTNRPTDLLSGDNGLFDPLFPDEPAPPETKEKEKKRVPKSSPPKHFPADSLAKSSRETTQESSGESAKRQVEEHVADFSTQTTSSDEKPVVSENRTEKRSLSKSVVIPRGMLIDVVLDQAYDYDMVTGDMHVTLSVANAVERSGITVIEAGAKTYAVLRKNTRRNELELEMLEVESVTGQRLKTFHSTFKGTGFPQGKQFRISMQYNRVK